MAQQTNSTHAGRSQKAGATYPSAQWKDNRKKTNRLRQKNVRASVSQKPAVNTEITNLTDVTYL